MSKKMIVEHPKLNFVVKGKSKHLPKGSEVELSDDQIKRLGKKVRDPSKTQESVKPDEKSQLVEASEKLQSLLAENEALKKAAAETAKKTK